MLKMSGNPAGMGRHNLSVLYGLATRLAEVAQAALVDEPGPAWLAPGSAGEGDARITVD